MKVRMSVARCCCGFCNAGSIPVSNENSSGIPFDVTKDMTGSSPVSALLALMDWTRDTSLTFGSDIYFKYQGTNTGGFNNFTFNHIPVPGKTVLFPQLDFSYFTLTGFGYVRLGGSSMSFTTSDLAIDTEHRVELRTTIDIATDQFDSGTGHYRTWMDTQPTFSTTARLFRNGESTFWKQAFQTRQWTRSGSAPGSGDYQPCYSTEIEHVNNLTGSPLQFELTQDVRFLIE